MTYTPYLIAKYATGFDRSVQPWLLPEDSQTVLLDGFVYRGVWEKRQGYTQYATGSRGGSARCESRMVHAIASAVIGTGDGIETAFSTNLIDLPVARGYVEVVYTVGGIEETAVDDGIGGFTGVSVDMANSSVDYATGAVTITFAIPPDSATDVSISYSAHQGFPVMGVMNFITEDNTKEMIVADTTYVNRYDTTANRLEDISPSYPLTGGNSNFFSWTEYPKPDASPRLLFVNNEDGIQQYDGTSVTPFPVYQKTGDPVLAGAFSTGNGTIGPYTWGSPVAVLPSTVTITDTVGSQTVTDNGVGELTGQGSGSIDYLNGTATVVFNEPVGAGNSITISYTPLTDPITTCLHIFQFQDRLIVVAPKEGAKQLGKTILISGTGRFGDIFATQAVAPGGAEVFISGSGRIDISDSSFLNSGEFNRDDLLLFTEGSAWAMKYTGNDAVPFQLARLDNSRGTEAPFATITYLNVTTGASPKGLIGCDGYSIERTDDKIPRFSFNDIDLDYFKLCYAGTVDEDRDHYLLYPSVFEEADSGKSDRILITNYEEFNYSIYRLPLSCMGTFFNTEDITWDNLREFDSWEEMAVQYGTWESFSYQGKMPIGIGGGHRGEIVSLNVSQTQDYPVQIRSVSGSDSRDVTITTDFQTWKENDYIFLGGMQGSEELNNKQGFILEVIDNYTFRVQIDVVNWFTFSPHEANTGGAAKVIQFHSVTKKFNPFSEQGKKVRCGWIYFYVDTTNTFLTEADEEGNELPVDAILRVRVITNDVDHPTDLTVPNGNYYEVNLSSNEQVNGSKKWVKIWVNQTANFIQLDLSNNQAGADVKIHAVMPGFTPVGRLS